jgi:hypothetical protein
MIWGQRPDRMVVDRAAILSSGGRLASWPILPTTYLTNLGPWQDGFQIMVCFRGL